MKQTILFSPPKEMEQTQQIPFRGIKLPETKIKNRKSNKNGCLFSNKLITKSLRQKSIELYVESKAEALIAYCQNPNMNLQQMKEKQRRRVSGFKLRPLSLSATKYPM